MDQPVAVITGASSGIGKATALELAHRGMHLVLVGRNKDTLATVADECRAFGVDIITVKADVTREQDVDRVVTDAVFHFGHISYWINNAGVIYYGRFMDIPQEDFRRVIETNLFGVVHGSRAALKQFTIQNFGTLINIGSGYGALPAPYASAYVTSKFAVRGLTASLRQEFMLDNYPDIHVCSVLPATIDTPIYDTAGNTMEHKPRAMPPVYPVEKAAKVIAKLTEKPKAEVVVGNAIRMGMITYALFPALFLKHFARYVRDHSYEKDTPGTDTSGNINKSESTGMTSGNWNMLGHKQES